METKKRHHDAQRVPKGPPIRIIMKEALLSNLIVSQPGNDITDDQAEGSIPNSEQAQLKSAQA
jgi:hypothetical protein